MFNQQRLCVRAGHPLLIWCQYISIDLKCDVVRFAVLISINGTALERVSVADTRAKIARHPSQGEIKYLERLVDKYGEDVERMARDRKLNAEQRTAGQLRRALKKAAAGK